MVLTTQSLLVSELSKGRAVPLTPNCVCLALKGTAFTSGMTWLTDKAQRLKQEEICVTMHCFSLRWFGHVQRMEVNRIPKRVLYMNLGTTRLRGRPRSRWQDKVREDGKIVGGEGWQEKVQNREEWKKLLRTARNRRILHMPME